jgi:hypothetical protein
VIKEFHSLIFGLSEFKTIIETEQILNTNGLYGCQSVLNIPNFGQFNYS